MTLKKTFIVAAVGIAILLSIFWWMQNRVELAVGKVAEASTVLKQIQADNAAQFQVMRVQVAAIEQERAQLQAANEALSRQVADREKVIRAKEQQLQERKSLALTSPLLDVAVRWAELAEAPPASIRVAPDENLLVEGLTARRTVGLLEEVPVLREQVGALELDKTDLRTQLTNEMLISRGWENTCRICTEKQALLDSEHKAALELAGQQLRLEKTKARRSKLRWALGAGAVGIVVGLVAR